MSPAYRQTSPESHQTAAGSEQLGGAQLRSMCKVGVSRLTCLQDHCTASPAHPQNKVKKFAPSGSPATRVLDKRAGQQMYAVMQASCCCVISASAASTDQVGPVCHVLQAGDASLPAVSVLDSTLLVFMFPVAYSHAGSTDLMGDTQRNTAILAPYLRAIQNPRWTSQAWAIRHLWRSLLSRCCARASTASVQNMMFDLLHQDDSCN